MHWSFPHNSTYSYSRAGTLLFQETRAYFGERADEKSDSSSPQFHPAHFEHYVKRRRNIDRGKPYISVYYALSDTTIAERMVEIANAIRQKVALNSQAVRKLLPVSSFDQAEEILR